MSDTPTAPAAAGGELTGVVSPAASTAPLSISAAAAVWADLDKKPEPPAAAAPEANAEPASTTPAEEAVPDTGDSDEPAPTEETAAEEDADPALEAETDTEADAESGEDPFAHGNMRMRLRDGRVLRVGDAKKLIDDAEAMRAKVTEFAAKEQQFQQVQQHAAQLEQQQQLVQQVWPAVQQALAIVQAQVPPEPDDAMLDPNSPTFDPDGHYAQTVRRQRALQRQEQIAGAIQAQQTQAQQGQMQQLATEHRKVLLEKIPDFQNPERAQEIYKGFVDNAGKYGISKQEVDTHFLYFDPRVVHWLYDQSRKAAAFDKLSAQKPAAQPAKPKAGAPPVQQPGPRVPAGQAQQQALNERVQQWRQKGGSKEEAIAIYAALNQ